MANQGADRREVLQMLAKAAAASQFPGFSRWAFAQRHEHGAEGAAPQRAAQYRPAYYSQAEYETIDILTGLIIPNDESPGAREAGVSEFIDFLAAHGEEEIREPMRSGLRWLEGASRGRYGKEFAALTAGQQNGILEGASKQRDEGEEGRRFFRLIRRYTVMGYYTSRAGLKELDYPGLRLYSESPECPHKDDPEHLHLPAPKV